MYLDEISTGGGSTFHLTFPPASYPLLSASHLEILHSRFVSSVTNSVYASRDQALDDLTRLHKLNDFDGIKLRVMQIYRERSEMEELVRDAFKVAESYLEDAEKRERYMQEVREAVRRGQDEANVMLAASR
jgi:hypothetical protein